MGPAVAAAVILILAGCTDNTPNPTTSAASSQPAREKPVQPRTEADATTQADTDVKTIAATLGSPLDGWKVATLPCTTSSGADAPNGAWQLQGGANIAVAAADQMAAIEKVQSTWQQQGWTITDRQTFANGTRGAVSAVNPATGTTITVTTTKDLGRVAVLLTSACYLPAPGEDPANT